MAVCVEVRGRVWSVSEGRIITVKATPKKMSQQEKRPRAEESLEGPRLALSPYCRFPNTTLQSWALFRSSKRLGKHFLDGKPDTCGHCPSPYRNWQMLAAGREERREGKDKKRRRGEEKERMQKPESSSFRRTVGKRGPDCDGKFCGKVKAQVFKWFRLFFPILLENFKE